MSALVVNFFGGPGTGKSTTAAGLFALLKARDVNAEYVHEFAKDLTWEDRQRALAYSPYVAAKQAWHVERVREQVEVILTDSPILMGLVYRGDGWTEMLGRHICETHAQWNTFNIFLRRNPAAHPYREAGRSQTEREAVELDTAIAEMLVRERVRCRSEAVQPGLATAEALIAPVLERLAGSQIGSAAL